MPNSQTLSLLGRDLREAHLQALLNGSGGYRSYSNAVSNTSADPFLSSFILNYPACEAEEISKSVVTSAEDSSTKNTTPVQQHIWKSRCFFIKCNSLITFTFPLCTLYNHTQKKKNSSTVSRILTMLWNWCYNCMLSFCICVEHSHLMCMHRIK